jgi:hypothetical protein
MAEVLGREDLPPELLKLTRGEQKYAVPIYQKLIEKFDADQPERHESNRGRALNAAYATGGRYWLIFAHIFALPAAIWLSFQCLGGVTSVGPGRQTGGGDRASRDAVHQD